MTQHQHSHQHSGQQPPSTPLPIIANVSRIVAQVVDRIMGDRNDYPLMVAAAVVEALKNFGIEGRIMYGQAAWVEVMENHTVLWAGCWGKNIHFWVETEAAETVDLNTSVAKRKHSHDRPEMKPLYSPPILWSREIPSFYRYKAEGIAELELTDPRDQQKWETVLREIREKCVPEKVRLDDPQPEFLNEPILCPGRRLLDDSNDTFKHFDRALSVMGLPEAPALE